MIKHLHIVCNSSLPEVQTSSLHWLLKMLDGCHEPEIHVHLHQFGNHSAELTFPDDRKTLYHYPLNNNRQNRCSSLQTCLDEKAKETLTQRLLEDDYPILITGVSGSDLLAHPAFANRKILLHMCCQESEYYKQMMKAAPLSLNKMYYWLETEQLKKREHFLLQKVSVTTSNFELWSQLRKHKKYKQAFKLNPSFQADAIKGLPGNGSYCFFSGDFSNPQQEKAAIWLLKEVFFKIQVPFVIAGNAPSPLLEELAHQKQHSCLVANPSPEELRDMMRKAHINIFYNAFPLSDYEAVKEALIEGRHCIISKNNCWSGQLYEICKVAGSAGEYRRMVQELYKTPFEESTLHKREVWFNEWNNSAHQSADLCEIIFA